MAKKTETTKKVTETKTDNVRFVVAREYNDKCSMPLKNYTYFAKDAKGVKTGDSVYWVKNSPKNYVTRCGRFALVGGWMAKGGEFTPCSTDPEINAAMGAPNAWVLTDTAKSGKRLETAGNYRTCKDACEALLAFAKAEGLDVSIPVKAVERKRNVNPAEKMAKLLAEKNAKA